MPRESLTDVKTERFFHLCCSVSQSGISVASPRDKQHRIYDVYSFANSEHHNFKISAKLMANLNLGTGLKSRKTVIFCNISMAVCKIKCIITKLEVPVTLFTLKKTANCYLLKFLISIHTINILFLVNRGIERNSNRCSSNN